MVATSVLEAGPSLASWARQTKRSELQRMLTLASGPGILSLALGLPAPELFPLAEIERVAASVLANETRALQYGPPLQSLKTHLVELMSQRGVECRESQVFLTTGAQQGLNILSRLLLDTRAQMLTEELSYPGFRQAIEPYQPEVLTVPTDLETGMDVDEVEWLLTNGAKPAFIYVITEGHNPLAVSLSREKRQRLVRLARDFRVPLVEDDPYGLLEYEGKMEPSLRALEADWVFYVGSFSKILAPALRVGWIIAPASLMPTLSIIKEASDIDTSTFGQRIVSGFIDAGHLPAHLEKLRAEYRSRRDSMLRALNEHFPVQASWRKPTGGVFTWVDLPKGLDVSELLRLSIEEERVAFIPSDAFALGINSRTHGIRLNFSHHAPAVIEEGIARIARILKETLRAGC